MKRLLVLLPVLLIGTACAKKPAEPLGPSDPEKTYYTVKMFRDNSGLTTDDSTSEIQTTLNALEDDSVEYSMRIGTPAYQHGTYDEFVLKDSAYVKSGCDYVVDRLVIEFYGPSVKFAVYDNEEGSGEELEYHESTYAPEHTETGDNAVVYEYSINGSGWMVKNVSAPQKSAFYSIRVVFSIE